MAWHNQLKTLVSRSECFIQTIELNFGDNPTVDYNFLDCLEAMPALKSFTMTYGTGRFDFTGIVGHFTLCAKPFLVPQLEFVKFDFLNGSCDGHSLIEMIQSRRRLWDNTCALSNDQTLQVAPSLGAVDICCMDLTFDSASLKKLRKLRNGGLDVVIRTLKVVQVEF